MWAGLSHFILRNRLPLLALVILFSGGMFYFSRRVTMSYHMAEVLPHSDKTYQDYQHFREIFGEEANVVIIAVRDPQFFSMAHLQSWMSFEEKLRGIPNVIWTLSPSSALNIRRNDDGDAFEFNSLLQDPPLTELQADSAKEIFYALPFYRDVLFNPDSSSYILLAGLRKNIVHSKERIHVVEAIHKEIMLYETQNAVDLRISGLPFIRTDVILRSKEEITLFTILAAVVASIALFIFFKSVRVLAVALSQVALSVIWASGTMGLLGFQITTLTGLIPPLLIVIGMPNAVYMITKYQQEFLKTGNKIRALTRMIQKTGRAILLTNITTAVGFATLVLTNSKLLTEFGIIASVNIMCLFVISLIWVPSMFSYLADPKPRHTRHLTNKRSNLFTQSLSIAVKSYRPHIFVCSGLALAIAVAGMMRIKPSGKVADDVPQHTKTFNDLAFFESHFNGVMPFEIMLDTRKRNKAKLSRKFWKKVSQLQDSIAVYPELSRPVSYIDLIKFSNQAYYDGRESEYALPNSFDLPAIQSMINRSDRGDTLGRKNDSLMQSYIDSSGQYVRIRAQIKDVGTFEMKRLVEKIRVQAESIMEDEETDITISGASIVIIRSTEYLLKNLLTSLTVAIIVIALIMAAMFRKLTMVVISLMPNFLPLLFTAGVMGYFGIPLKASTCIIFSVAFGISVDDTIHFLAKYRQELKHHHGNIREATYSALRETGLSMAYTSIILFFGFSVFIASDFGSTKALGVLVSLTLLVAMLSNLTLLPALLLTLQGKQIDKDYDKYSIIEEDDEETDAEEQKTV